MSRNQHIISHDSSKQDRNIGARKKSFSETILAAMIDEWTVFWRAPKEKQNDRAMITLYQLRTNANLGLTNFGNATFTKHRTKLFE